MTQPNLHQTFDTSLVDLSLTVGQNSFSTTDSVPSDEYRDNRSKPLPTTTAKIEEATTASSKMPTRYVPTVEAYNAWAKVYDTDGNMLQAADDYALSVGNLMQTFINETVRHAVATKASIIEIIDLGCGTGRNTLTVMKRDWPVDRPLRVTGIDASKAMLEIACKSLRSYYQSLPGDVKARRGINLIQHDFLDPADATRDPVPLNDSLCPAKPAGVISTLVLEHFPLKTFFAVLGPMVGPGGMVFLTNMHADMGSHSQAGFVSQNSQTGEPVKIRGTSWVHTTAATIHAAEKSGFELVGDVGQLSVDEDMIQKGILGEKARKWLGVRVWFGIVLRKVR